MVTVAMKLKGTAPWKKNDDKPRQHIKKKKTLLGQKNCLLKAMFFPVVMYGHEIWIIKKAEH